MTAKEDFLKVITNEGYDYVGNGNPNAKILFMSKEPAISKNENFQMYACEILDNRKLWYDKIINHSTIPTGKDPSFPYKGQKCKRVVWLEDKKGNGGTSRTWIAYQRLYDSIAENSKKSKDDCIDFHKYVFSTDLSSEAAKTSNGTQERQTRESIRLRMNMFREDFFQNFPIVIMAVGHYPKKYGVDIQSLFDVTWTGKTFTVGKQWVNLHYNKTKTKIVVHTCQLSRYSNNLINYISDSVKRFIIDDLKSDIETICIDV